LVSISCSLLDHLSVRQCIRSVTTMSCPLG